MSTSIHPKDTTETPATAGEHRDLPIEVIAIIIQHMADPELARSMSASSSLYLLAAPILYHHLVIEFGDESAPNPLGALADAKRGIGYDALESASSPPFPFPSNNLAQPALSQRISLPSRFSYTRVLTIYEHNQIDSKCAGYPSVEMPNIHTIRVRPEGDDHARLCGSSCCNVVRHLRPSTVILGDADTGLTGETTYTGLWQATVGSRLPSFVKHVKLYVGDNVRPGWDNITSLLPDNLERFTLLIEPQNGRGGMWSRRAVCTTCQDDGFDDSLLEPAVFVDDLADCCVGTSAAVELVGVELVCPEWAGDQWTVEAMQQEIRDLVVSKSVEKGMDKEEAEKKAERVMFTRREKYEEREWRQGLSA